MVPLIPNGSYNGGGMTSVEFNRDTSISCGISVVEVLQGNLQGLVRRDDFIQLNPNADSMRLKIEVSGPLPKILSSANFCPKLPGYQRFVRKVSVEAKVRIAFSRSTNPQSTDEHACGGLHRREASPWRL